MCLLLTILPIFYIFLILQKNEGVESVVYLEREMSSLVECLYSDLFVEATNQVKTHIMLEKLYPNVEEVLSTSLGDRRYKELVGNFIDKNNEKLHTPGPVYMIPFTDRDKAEFFKLFKISSKEIVSYVDEVLKTIQSKSEFRLLRGNPIFWLFYLCIRFYTLKGDKKGLNCALAIYALSVYPSIFSLFFKYGANEGVMQYTIDNLTEKFIIKQAGHIFGALLISINHSYEFLKPYMQDACDTEIIRFIQRIRNDQKSMIKKICDQYMKNHAKGLRVSSNKASNSTEVIIDDEYTNKTSNVENVSQKICLKIFTDGVDLAYAGIAAKISGVSVADTRLYLSKLLIDKYTNNIQKFVESVLFLYLYDENKEPEDINSKGFLMWAEELFRKTNSNNANIRNIKDSLDQWAEEIGVHARFKRLASRVNYKKAIYFYFILIIQKYNNG